MSESIRAQLAADPADVDAIQNLSSFLTLVLQDETAVEQTSKLYAAALAAAPNRTDLLLHYANFLLEERNMVQEAEALYRRSDLAHARARARARARFEGVCVRARAHACVCARVCNSVSKCCSPDPTHCCSKSYSLLPPSYSRVLSSQSATSSNPTHVRVRVCGGGGARACVPS